MRKLLIAEQSEELRDQLIDLLHHRFDITICIDGGTAASLIQSLRPDVLILDLMLPVKDGFYILEEVSHCLPPVVICTTAFSNDYISQTARDLGVGYLVIKPCHPRVIISRLDHMLLHHPPDHSDGQNKAARILLELQFNPKNDGFRFLKVGIPLYAQDPQQLICKELYVAIAQICGAGSWNQVERSIRSAIDTAWKSNAAAWSHYFPGAETPPTGKTFISRIAHSFINS